MALTDINALYGDSHVLHDVSFAVSPGRVLALLGRNGAGKTTCMSTIIGFLPPRDGDIRLFGESITRLAPEAISRKGIGFVPQGRRIFPTLTVRENLLVAQQSRQGVYKSWTLDRVCELFPKLQERLAQHAGSLSGGEQQMLAVSRALMLRPKLLLLDEPSFGLAPLIVREIFGIMREINQSERVSILLVEQNAAMALDLADRAYLIETGRVVLSGTSAEIKQDEAVRRSYLGY